MQCINYNQTIADEQKQFTTNSTMTIQNKSSKAIQTNGSELNQSAYASWNSLMEIQGMAIWKVWCNSGISPRQQNMVLSLAEHGYGQENHGIMQGCSQAKSVSNASTYHKP